MDVKKYWWIIVVILVAVFWTYLFYNFTIDDAYIIYRYAEHLIQGNGIVWNIGEAPVEGYSNFIWVLFSTIPLVVKVNVVTFTKVLGIIFAGLTLVFTHLFAKRLYPKNKFAFIPVLLLAFTFPLFLWGVSGLGTSAFVFFVLGFLYFGIEKEKYKEWFTLFSILLILSRPEGIIVFVFFIIYDLVSSKDRINSLKMWAIPVLALAAYLLFKQLYFGDIFPNTFYFKKALFAGGDYIITFLTAFFPLVVFELFSLIIAPKKLRKQFYLLFGVQIVMMLAYLNINPMQGNYYRFLMPVIPLMLFFTPLFFDKIIVFKDKVLRAGLTILILVAVVLLLVYPAPNANFSTDVYAWNIDNMNIAIGTTLAEKYPANTRIALSDAGAIPYYSKFYTVDLLGLNDPYIAKNGLQPEYVMQKSPDIIILVGAFRQEGFKSHLGSDNAMYAYNDLHMNYVQTMQFKGTTTHGEDAYYLIFEKKQS